MKGARASKGSPYGVGVFAGEGSHEGSPYGGYSLLTAICPRAGLTGVGKCAGVSP